ncbi:carbohydrate kinase [Microbacterium capsulatum]|uniref:Carbohydrate kinase n=1 Tax=Microbacterium capsulatum TaxID=3041921 RepID=A0ABU0XLP3_9MICO|nr:carbohydrate kinase [Microbacterium sp. ASV81]MDQ4215508.1 carbohydrate kinase [Microbacterium sp. ASV81]
MSPHFLVIGEALIDIVDRDGERSHHVGGSPLNVAFGLGRLGVRTVFATEFGDDADGTAIATHLASAGVAIERTDDVSRRTSTSLARIGADGSASYDFHVAWAFRTPPPVGDAQAVHVGSIGAFLAPGGPRVLELIESLPAEVLVSFDPNIRPAFVPSREETRELVERYAARATIVKLSDEDAEWLYPGRADDVAGILLGQGARLVAITRGAEGSTLYAPGATVQVPARPTRAVDTIGAGDAYMSGLLAAIAAPSGMVAALQDLSAADLAAIGRIAAESAAITVGRAGAMPPTAEELERAGRAPVGDVAPTA